MAILNVRISFMVYWLFVGYTVIFFIVYGIHLFRDYVGNRFGRYKDINDFDILIDSSDPSDSSDFTYLV